MKRLSWITLILGIWLIASPFALGYASTAAAMKNDMSLGVLLLVCSGWIVGGRAESVVVDWFEILCSIWLCAAPFALHYQQVSHALANDVVVGVITLLAGLIEAWTLMLEPAKA